MKTINNTTTDRFNLTYQDYQNVLKAIKQVYGANADHQINNPFCDTDIDYDLIDMYPNSNIDSIDIKFKAFIQDLMAQFNAKYDDDFTRETWVTADSNADFINVSDVYKVIENRYL